MALATVEIRGEAEMRRIFRLLPQRVSKQLQMKALKEGSKPLISTARNEAPKRTGTLIKSIGIVTDKNNRGAGIYVAVRKGNRQHYDGWYGWFVEGGTKGVGRRTRTKGEVTYKYGAGHGIKANPFFERAWEATKTIVEERITETIKRVVVDFLKKNAPMYR